MKMQSRVQRIRSESRMAKIKKPGKGQQTGAQVVVDTQDQIVGVNNRLRQLTPAVLLEMNREPTIGLARDLSVAPAMLEPWTVETRLDDEIHERAADLTRNIIKRWRDYLVRTAMYAHADHGWKGYEIAYNLVDLGGDEGQRWVIDWINALDNSRTWQQREQKTNRFIGLKHQDTESGNDVYVDELHSLFVNFDYDGQGNYGEPLANRAYTPWCQWNNANDGADRYDQKAAGAFLVVKYPVGQTPYGDSKTLTDNATIADNLAQALRASGYATLPVVIEQDDMSVGSETVLEQWKIEMVAGGAGIQADFVDRLKYLDARKVRAYGIPERAVLEGTFGTKAEAEAHGDVALLLAHMAHRFIISEFNKKVDYLMEINYALPPGSVTVVLGDVSDSRRASLSLIFEKFLADATLGPEIVEKVDVDAMMQIVGVPVVDSLDDADDTDDVNDSDTEQPDEEQPDDDTEQPESEDEPEAEPSFSFAAQARGDSGCFLPGHGPGPCDHDDRESDDSYRTVARNTTLKVMQAKELMLERGYSIDEKSASIDKKKGTVTYSVTGPNGKTSRVTAAAIHSFLTTKSTRL